LNDKALNDLIFPALKNGWKLVAFVTAIQGEHLTWKGSDEGLNFRNQTKRLSSATIARQRAVFNVNNTRAVKNASSLLNVICD